MADPGYVRSTDGSDADNGSTWALANATLVGGAADATAGDTIYCSQVHAETQASAMSAVFPGTPDDMNKIVFVSDAAEPPTTLNNGGSVSTTGTNGITLGGSFYWRGGSVNVGSGSGNVNLTLAQADGCLQVLEGVNLTINATGTSGRILVGNGASSTVESRAELRNCVYKFGNTAQGFNLTRSVLLSGGSIDNAGSKPANLLATAPSCAIDAIIERFDASNCATTFNWIAGSPVASGRVILRDCKVPASWTGDLLAGTPGNPSFRVEGYNIDSGASNYKFWIRDYYGTIIQETTIVRTGGASDGDTTVSAKMVSNANAAYPGGGLRSMELQLRLDASGSSRTLTFELVTDNVTLTDADICVDVMHLGNSGDTLGAKASSHVAVLTTPSNLASSSETWTTTGLTTPVKQALSVTFTPQQEGVIVVTVTLFRPSTTVYVDIEPTVA